MTLASEVPHYEAKTPSMPGPARSGTTLILFGYPPPGGPTLLSAGLGSALSSFDRLFGRSPKIVSHERAESPKIRPTHFFRNPRSANSVSKFQT